MEGPCRSFLYFFIVIPIIRSKINQYENAKTILRIYLYFHVLGQKSQNSSSVDGEGSVKQEIDQLQIENNLMPWADSNSKAAWTMGFICIYC